METDRLSTGYWYHSIRVPRDNGEYVTTPGEYDHNAYLSRYGFPESLSNKTVIDVGAADGYFAFEFERRGAARVLAVDIAAYPDVPFHEVESFGQGVARGATRFELVRERLGSAVERREVSIYDLGDEQGTFDLVFCGSLLLHLTDPLAALVGLRRVCGDRLILATAYYHEPVLALYETCLRAAMKLSGKKTGVRFAALTQTEMDDTFWLPTKAGLLDMVARSGFRDARIHSTFRLDRRDGRRGWPHAVVHARV